MTAFFESLALWKVYLSLKLIASAVELFLSENLEFKHVSKVDSSAVTLSPLTDDVVCIGG